MPKPPITVPIARSSYPLVIHSLLAVGLVGVGFWMTASPWMLVALPACLWLVFRHARRQPTGTLFVHRVDEALYARWLSPNGEQGEQRPLRCSYLGPWLLGLDVGRTRLWLWPDSLPGESHRALRRLLHRPGH